MSSSSGIFARLGLVGLSSLEPPILASLITQSPLLLIGPHGSGKSLLLERIAESLDLSWRHYNASLLNFDDLVGYPMPDSSGQLKFIQTPASVWGAQAVFIDEISRARVDIQNRLFPIIHEKKVQGLPLTELQHRWAAMNPPPDREDDNPQEDYAGSVELDLALADRFPFQVRMPDWSKFSEEDQGRVILSFQSKIDLGIKADLAKVLSDARDCLPTVTAQWSEGVARYVRIISRILLDAKRTLSARRASMLAKNILAVHAVLKSLKANGIGDESHAPLGPSIGQLPKDIKALAQPRRFLASVLPKASKKENLCDATWIALLNSMPFAASGIILDEGMLLRAHKEAWKLADMNPNSPLLMILNTTDPLERVKLAVSAKGLPEGELTEIVVDALTNQPIGAKHALAEWLFESKSVAKLSVVAADEAAKVYRELTCLQEIHESTTPQSSRHLIWQRIEQKLGILTGEEDKAERLANMLSALFCSKQLNDPEDVDRALNAFSFTHARLLGEAA